MLPERILAAAAKPASFQKGTAQLWTDDHISQQMLLAHLDPNTDAASRKPETIRRSVDWIHNQFCKGNKGLEILDLGCGPGLYTSPLSTLGHSVTGVDFSSRSIEYARKQASSAGLSVRYFNEDYLSFDFTGSYDVIMMIYCDFGVFDEAERNTILRKVFASLKPNGVFLFDVFQPARYQDHEETKSWHAAKGGFWRKSPYLCLESSYWYEAAGTHLNSYIILDDSNRIETYHIWDKTFTPGEISTLLRQYGFCDVDLYSDVTGEPYQERSNTLCAVARKK